MTPAHEESRTLVKSPPELWAELSDATSLSRHLQQFGEIRITRLEPETAVAWEGERASGTVRLEPSGWGTKVIMTAKTTAAAEPEPEPEPAAPAAPAAREEVPAPPPQPRRRPSLLSRLFGHHPTPAPPPPPRAAAPPPPPAPKPQPATPPTEAADQAAEILAAALDSLGQAHHRPFSRS